MGTIAHFRALQGYEEWASAKSIAALRTAETAGGDRDACRRAASIFGHIQGARHEWLARLGRLERRAWVMFPACSVDEAAADAARLDGEYRRYLAELTDADLDGEVKYQSFDGRAWVSLRREILTHVYNHSTYHRGQLAVLVKMAGGTPPDSTDYIVHSRRSG